MGLREKLNDAPGVVAGMLVALVAVIAVFLWMAFRSPDGIRHDEGSLYYTIDDGKSYFVDKATRATPFAVDGKEAVQAVVFSCDGNATRFVGYLRRQRASAKAPTGTGKPGSQYNVSVERLGVEVKRAGESKWIPLASVDGLKLTQVTCPDGKTRPVPVTP